MMGDDEEEIEVEMEDAMPQPPPGPPPKRVPPASAPLRAVKEEVGRIATTLEFGMPLQKVKVDPDNRAPLTERELFIEKKRSDGNARDAGCRAMCKIKLGLRRPQAQDDGRPFIPANWEEDFKPLLGSYIKFILGRPDQFRVHKGAGPGLYTIENVSGPQTVEAASWEKIAEAKGKGKGKFKSKGKDKSIDGTVFKGKDKGKAKGKGKNKNSVKGKGKGCVSKGIQKGKGATSPRPAGGAVKTEAVVSSGGVSWAALAKRKLAEIAAPQPTTKAAKILAEVAKEELAKEAEPITNDSLTALEGELLEEWPVSDDEEAVGNDEYWGDVEASAEDGASQEPGEAPEEHGGQEEVEGDAWLENYEAEEVEAEGQESTAGTTAKQDQKAKQGSFIRGLLGGGMMGGSRTRPAAV